ncbi:MAG TPA: archease [Archaeoglobaceae archaeon]|nr:archease [Archaeoglobaceae archaeon]
MGYRFIDHTADIAFEVEGETLADLLKNSADAFNKAFTYPEELSKERVERIEMESDGADYLLLKWLNELLFLFDTEFFAAKEINVEVDEEKFSAKGILKGSTINPELVKVEPKAITLHDFKVEKRNGWYAFVVIDI